MFYRLVCWVCVWWGEGFGDEFCCLVGFGEWGIVVEWRMEMLGCEFGSGGDWEGEDFEVVGRKCEEVLGFNFV